LDSLVSIIVPVYNAEGNIKRCIESILQQSYKNIQLILINDGSTDKSLDICNYFKSIDNRIIVINKQNEGVSATRNSGINLAEGDYIGFVDSDDYIEKEMYETMLNQIRKNNSQACVLMEYTINSFAKHRSHYNNNVIDGKDAVSYLFSLSFPTSCWAYLYKKDIVKNNYLNEEVHFFEDFEFNFRALQSSHRISLCYERLYNYITNEESINSQKINDKRITSLNIYNDIIEDMKDKDNRQLIKQASFFRVAFLIGIILSLSRSNKEAEQKYYSIVHENAKGMIKDILFSFYVPLKYKIVILMCVMNTHLTCNLIHLLR
jgi:glycosyltransferase EpsJ